MGENGEDYEMKLVLPFLPSPLSRNPVISVAFVNDVSVCSVVVCNTEVFCRSVYVNALVILSNRLCRIWQRNLLLSFRKNEE
jgi:hypothetical protein